MAFKKGISGNPGGRKPGIKNKTTSTTKNWVQDLVNSNRDQLELDLMALNPKDRWDIVQKLLSFCIPKQKESIVNFSQLDENQLDVIINELVKH